MNGKRLEQIRIKRGLSRAQLAELAGVSVGALGYYERSERDPDMEKLSALCHALHVSADYLLGLSDNEGPTDPVPELDPVRAQKAAHLSTLIYQLAAMDQGAAYDRDCLPVYGQILEALLELVQDTDETFESLRKKYPAFTSTTPGSIPEDLRLSYITENMTDPSKAAKDWADAMTEFANKTNTHASGTGNRIHFLIALDLLGCLLANGGRNVESGPIA